MNLGELRTAVRLRANVPATDGIWTASFVDDAINEAAAIVSLEHPWPWLQVKVATNADANGVVDLAALAVDVRDVAHVFVEDYEAKKVSSAETDLVANVGPADARYVWSIWGDTLQIRSAPPITDTVTVRYYRDEARLTADTDTLLMPAVYHPCVVEKACSIGFESTDDQTSAAMHEARSRMLVERMTANALRRIRGRHSVRVRPGYPY